MTESRSTPPERITVERSFVFDLVARLTAASRQLGLVDEFSLQNAAQSALVIVDDVGRKLAELIGADASAFGSSPPPSVRDRARAIVAPSRRTAGEALAEVIVSVLPRGSNPELPAGRYGWRPTVRPEVPPPDDDHAFEETPTPVQIPARRA